MFKPIQCEGCWLEKKGYGFFGKSGNGRIDIELVVGEVEQGDANRGKNLTKYGIGGSVWNRIIEKKGRHWDEFKYDSAIRCSPLFKIERSKTAISCCDRHWQIGEAGRKRSERKKLYLTSGKVATELCLGFPLEEKRTIDYIHGFVFDTPWGWVMPIHDLRMIKEGQFVYSYVVERDVEKALEFARGDWDPFAERKLKQYKVDAGEKELEGLIRHCYDNSKLWLAYDLEGETIKDLDEDEKTREEYPIYSVQASIQKHKAFEFRVLNRPGLWDGVKELLKLSNKKVAHNVWNFDNPILKAQGIEINGDVFDSMWMFKHFYAAGGVNKKKTGEEHIETGVRKHLQTVASMAKFPFPWKHTVKEAESNYGCCDVDALRYVFPYLREGMKAIVHPESGWSLYKGFYEHVLKLERINRAAQGRGIDVDARRLDKFKRRFDKVIERSEQRVNNTIPEEIKQVRWYKGIPPEVKRVGKAITARGIEGNRYKKLLIINATRRGYKWDEETGLWGKILPFKLSSQGLKRYVEYKRNQCTTLKERAKWRLERNFKTDKETTGKKSLEKLAERTGDVFLTDIVQMRSTLSTISNMVKNWKPKSDGAVHPEWRYDAPTGQLSTKYPNAQNASKHTRMGQLFRWNIYVRNGKVYIEFDFKSFHVAMMGFLAKDIRYYQFSQVDMHSIVYSHILGRDPIPFTTPLKEIKAWCKELRRDKDFEYGRTEQAKPAVLGNQLGLGPTRLWLNTEPHIKSKGHAQEIQGVLAALFPLEEKLKADIRSQAHRNEILVNYYGRCQRFYQVYQPKWDKYTKSIKLGWGKEHDKAMAFPIQSNAFGYVFEKLNLLEEEEYLEEFGYCNTIHDSLIFKCDVEKADKCIEVVKTVLEQPSEVLKNEILPNGFTVGCEVSMGKNWRKYQKHGNPHGMQEVNV